ncbi:hypothetical protein CHS0354_023232 [Potamilus streckersoni]|uniref:Uncharacterized protein n=1 Tax=Potamilus streckersoni TaxID=2493646 RepID=A0AAE0SJ89_9BIVA|nr:hypothetical protein CHS0354_023232 [Potamilus streckersoni]
MNDRERYVTYSRTEIQDFGKCMIFNGRNRNSIGSSGYESTDVSDTESVKSCETREVYVDEPEIMTFRSLHSLGHSLSFITEVPELCDVKFLVGENEVPVYGVKAIMGTRSSAETQAHGGKCVCWLTVTLFQNNHYMDFIVPVQAF